jgi:hypothetical protein
MRHSIQVASMLSNLNCRFVDFLHQAAELEKPLANSDRMATTSLTCPSIQWGTIYVSVLNLIAEVRTTAKRR